MNDNSNVLAVAAFDGGVRNKRCARCHHQNSEEEGKQPF